LFERLRQLRKRLAQERGLPAYIILHDSALRRLAGECPVTLDGLASIKGVGAKRAEDFGALFLREIGEFMEARKRA
jgi:ATP-dependent DNA helicase RecQ